MKKNDINVAKVNKEIGGWDYKGYHIDRNKAMKCLEILVEGDEVIAKTLGEAKKIVDEIIRDSKKADVSVIEFTSKRGTQYLVAVKGDKIVAFTYENGKKTYWAVTKEIRTFVSAM